MADEKTPGSLVATLRGHAVAAGIWSPSSCCKGKTLLRQGEERDSVFVLTAGVVKLTYLSAEGDEWIKSFILDGGLFGALGRGKAGSRFGARVIEASRIAELPGHWVRRILIEDAEIAAHAAAFTAWLAERKMAREEALLCQSVEERYRALLAEEPELLARLPQGDIARYLRVTPIAFSRIKRRVGTAPSPS